MSLTRPSRPDRPARAPRSRRWTAVVVLGAVASIAALPALQPSAAAVPAPCQPQFAPRDCDPPDPDPWPEPPPPTAPPPPTTVPPPPAPIPWTADVSVLDQSGTGFDRSVTGHWWRRGGPGLPTGTVAWSDAAQQEGTIMLPDVTLPPGGPVAMELFSNLPASPWITRLCRTEPGEGVAPPGLTARVLLAPTVMRTPDELSAVVSGLAGRVQPDPAGAEVTITSATIAPLDGALLVVVRGRLWRDVQWPLPNLDATFAYAVMLTVTPSSVLDTDVVRVGAHPGILQLEGDGITDDIELAFAGNAEPQFRDAVTTKATQAVNASIAADPQAAWFRSLGYTVSARSVTVTPAGLALSPSLCALS